MAVKQQSELHRAALAWVEAGFAVFPCVPQGKAPATAHGLNDATTDPFQINSWWEENPSYNVGVSPARSAMFVLDVDPPLGAETLNSLESEHGALPPTLAIRTPRGGLHYWFTGSCPSSVGTDRRGLGPKLDTRGEGGYVLVPPSVVVYPGKKIEGTYGYETDTNEIAEGPGWIARRVHSIRDRHEAADSFELDTPSAIERARVFLSELAARGSVAIEGKGGDDHTYQTAASVLALGVSPRVAWELLRDHWNPYCIPPWDEDELATKVQNAADYMQNDIGAWAVAPAEETFAAFAGMEQNDAPAGSADKRARFYPRDEAEQDTLPEPTWLIKDMLPADSVALLYGPPGSWKSFLALDIALTLSSGIARYGAPERSPVDTVYVAAEGARGIVRLRRPAWRMAHHIDRPLPFYAIDTMPTFSHAADAIALIEAIKARGLSPRLLVIDTVARAMAGMNENDAQDVGEFIEALDMLKRALGCTVLAIHHSGKDHDRGARGSSAFLGGVDTMLEVKAHHASRALALHVRKQKDADEAETPWTFEGHVVGPSLVFFETDTDTHRKLTKSEDAYSTVKVGAALRELKATSEVAAVSSLVLATHLTPLIMDETPEERNRAIARTSRSIVALSESKLQGYSIGSGKSLKWMLSDGVQESPV